MSQLVKAVLPARGRAWFSQGIAWLGGYVGTGWISSQPGMVLPPALVRSPDMVGIWAEVGAERMLADVLPDGSVILCAPQERPGMQQSLRGV